MNKSTALLAGLLSAGALVLAPLAASADTGDRDGRGWDRDRDRDTSECRAAQNDLILKIQAVLDLSPDVLPAVTTVRQVTERRLRSIVGELPFRSVPRATVQTAIDAFDNVDRVCERPRPTVTVTPTPTVTVTPPPTTTIVAPPTIIVQRPRGGVDTGA